MRYFGYPCMNISKKLTTSRTIRVNSFTLERWLNKCMANLNDLYAMLQDCHENGYKIFRIGSGVIPLATHEITQGYDWRVIFKEQFDFLARYIQAAGIRITMHPDHFVVLNSPREDIYEKSVKDLQYHADLMDLLKLDTTCKMQIHTGGVYGNKNNSIQRWIERYNQLPEPVKRRLVLENDDKSYSLDEVMYIHQYTGVPILFDTLHHECLNTDHSSHTDAFKRVVTTWTEKDGYPLIDYSSQEPGCKLGKHASTIDLVHFNTIKGYLDKITPKYDVILEIKDKERSAAILFQDQNG